MVQPCMCMTGGAGGQSATRHTCADGDATASLPRNSHVEPFDYRRGPGGSLPAALRYSGWHLPAVRWAVDPPAGATAANPRRPPADHCGAAHRFAAASWHLAAVGEGLCPRRETDPRTGVGPVAWRRRRLRQSLKASWPLEAASRDPCELRASQTRPSSHAGGGLQGSLVVMRQQARGCSTALERLVGRVLLGGACAWRHGICGVRRAIAW